MTHSVHCIFFFKWMIVQVKQNKWFITKHTLHVTKKILVDKDCKLCSRLMNCGVRMGRIIAAQVYLVWQPFQIHYNLCDSTVDNHTSKTHWACWAIMDSLFKEFTFLHHVGKLKYLCLSEKKVNPISGCNLQQFFINFNFIIRPHLI